MANDEVDPAAAASGAEPPAGRARRKRWGDAKAAAAATTGAPAAPPATASDAALDPRARVLALQESVRARLAAAKGQAGVGGAAAPSLKRTAAALDAPGESQNTSKRAKHFELDLTQTAPTFQSDIKAAQAAAVSSAQPKGNPYLAHQADAASAAAAASDAFDPSLPGRGARARPRHRELNFVEPGHYQQLAETKRQLAAKAQAAGFASGRKTGHTIHAANQWAATATATDADDSAYYAGAARGEDELWQLPPRADANPDAPLPLAVEWWDAELLPPRLKRQLAAQEAQALTRRSKAAMRLSQKEEAGTKPSADDGADDATTAALVQSCFEQASLLHSKTSSLVQHIVPVQPPHFVEVTQPPVLHLTKKELKRQRKLRRQAKQRELQDLQAAGLVPAPEPRLTLRNFIQVLGDQAFLDPSQMEQKVAEQMAKRQQAHAERNARNKLTKEQRAAKRARRLQEDTSRGVHVAVFLVKDMSHPYHRAKVDLNAQQHYISGGVLECEHPKLACVICEGGPKAIQRYTRLMLVRMKWTGSDDSDDEDYVDGTGEDQEQMTRKFNPDNKCELVWHGMAVKPAFKGFSFQACETSDLARKMLQSKGVEHYWDQVLAHAQGQGKQGLQPKLASSDESEAEEEENPYTVKDDEDIIMRDES